MREEDGGCAAAAAEEGAPSETTVLLLLLPAAAAAPSSVVVRSRSAPLSSDGAGVCAARVTNACDSSSPTVNTYKNWPKWCAYKPCPPNDALNFG